jgi:hypothetical protein
MSLLLDFTVALSLDETKVVSNKHLYPMASVAPADVILAAKVHDGLNRSRAGSFIVRVVGKELLIVTVGELQPLLPMSGLRLQFNYFNLQQ